MTASRRDFFRFGVGLASASITWHAKAFVIEKTVTSRREQETGAIRLYSNENAYGPTARVIEVIKSAAVDSNRYPRLRYPDLIQRIAASHEIKSDQILLGCGSTEILRIAASAFLAKGKRLIHASPTFEAIEHYAGGQACEIVPVPLTSSFAHDLPRMLAEVTPSTSLVYVCNPNNPTASLTPRKELETFISKLPESTLVFIDEAYHHYADKSTMYESFIDHPFHEDRVIVARTFSKVYGLAGLRVGYAVAPAKIIQQMKRFATEDNINNLATQAAFVALDDAEAIANFIERNADDRQEFFNQAMARSLKPIDSHANFVMMNTLHPAEEVIDHFRRHNILIGRAFPPMHTYIRVSLGLPEEMVAFWRAWDLLPYAKNGMQH